MKRSGLLAFSGFAVFVLFGTSQMRADDLERLQGDWVFESYFVNNIHIEVDEGASMTITGNRASTYKEDRKGNITFTIDETQNPKHITQTAMFEAREWVCPGIYKFECEKLIICGRPGFVPDVLPRPPEFKSDKQTHLLILRRP